MLVVAAFYRFFQLNNPRVVRDELEELFSTSDIYGTILLAKEGINGTVCGSREHIDRLRRYFSSDERMDGMEYKESSAATNPFLRRHIKIKKEIVTMGKPNGDEIFNVGRHVDAREWDALLSDPSVFVLDVRNRYETAIGKFSGAHDPGLDNFSEFPDYVARNLDKTVHKRIAMSCTGGIRCEKASAYLVQAGFEEVYQLNGGVLRYLEDTPKEQSKWQGECFVFDHRVAVDHDLQPGSYTMCFNCRYPLNVDDKKSEKYVEAVACAHCHESVSEKKRRARVERHKQIQLASARGEKHLGSQGN